MRIASTRSSHRVLRRLFAALVLVLVSSTMPAVPIAAAPTHTDIVSAGPLSTIFLANDLSQQIQHTGDGAGPCVIASFSGLAVEQKAHSAERRPMIQCVRPQPGQWFTSPS